MEAAALEMVVRGLGLMRRIRRRRKIRKRRRGTHVKIDHIGRIEN